MIYFMSIIGGKRLETVPVKFSESEKMELAQIAKEDDRGLGYIVRELAFRGLAAYKSDGCLKATEKELQIIEHGKTETSNAEYIGKQDPKTATIPGSRKGGLESTGHVTEKGGLMPDHSKQNFALSPQQNNQAVKKLRKA